MTKSKSSTVTRDIIYLTIDTFLDVVVKKNFQLLLVGWYLFRVVNGNRYLPGGSNVKCTFILLALVMYLLPDGYTFILS